MSDAQDYLTQGCTMKLFQKAVQDYLAHGGTVKSLAHQFGVSLLVPQRWADGVNAPHEALRGYVVAWMVSDETARE